MGVSRTNVANMIDYILGKPATRYVAILFQNPRESGQAGGSEIMTISDLSELSSKQFDKVDVIDLKHLADTAPNAIRDLARGE